jgi:hypothetical protein
MYPRSQALKMSREHWRLTGNKKRGEGIAARVLGLRSWECCKLMCCNQTSTLLLLLLLLASADFSKNVQLQRKEK